MSHAITPSGRAVNPWWIGLTLTIATFMELLDTSIANVSLPHIAGGLGTSLDSWSENVSADEMRQCAERLRAFIADMKPGFRLLNDLTGLESTDPNGASYIAAMMDLLAAKQVGLIVRVIPDPHKDIGLHILSYFHYGSQVQIVTYQNLRDALQSLSD